MVAQQLGATSAQTRRMANLFTKVPSQQFERARIASVSTDRAESMALSEEGVVYVWNHLGPVEGRAVLGPEFFNNEAVGIYAKIPRCFVLAFAMGTHARLGAAGGCLFADMCGDLIERLFATADRSLCGFHTEGVTRLLGGPAAR